MKSLTVEQKLQIADECYNQQKLKAEHGRGKERRAAVIQSILELWRPTISIRGFNFKPPVWAWRITSFLLARAILACIEWVLVVVRKAYGPGWYHANKEIVLKRVRVAAEVAAKT